MVALLRQRQVKKMADYKTMYYKLFRATDKAIELLISAQRECEELYCSSEEPDPRPLDFTQNSKEEE